MELQLRGVPRGARGLPAPPCPHAVLGRGERRLLFDGTCWRDDELIQLGLADKTAWEMAHLPIAGPEGSLECLSVLPIERKIYIHINNTIPILLEDAQERRVVEERGMEVAMDGLEVQV